tara:strand:- start:96 stop:272 length:177 start_codon:yes stop_codon:yes gene_type:complete
LRICGQGKYQPPLQEACRGSWTNDFERQTSQQLSKAAEQLFCRLAYTGVFFDFQEDDR